MSEMFSHLLKALPLIAIISALCGWIGWWFRGSGTPKASPVKAPTPEKSGQDRSKNLEAALEKSKATYKALKAEYDEQKSSSISRDIHEKTVSELEAMRQSLAAESRRSRSLEADLKRSQENIKTLNARANELEKAQKERGFALQNELSKTREELAILQNRPDNSAGLELEVERLRESVATANRYVGELRKREAAALEEIEKVKAQLSQTKDADPLTPTAKIGPVGDSGRVAAAKAEVLRLLEENKRKSSAAAEPVTAPVAPLPEADAPEPLLQKSEAFPEEIAAPSTPSSETTEPILATGAASDGGTLTQETIAEKTEEGKLVTSQEKTTPKEHFALE